MPNIPFCQMAAMYSTIKTLIKRALCVVLPMLTGGPAEAFVSAGASQQVQLTVVAACTVSAPAAVTFGNAVTGSAAPSPVTTTISVSCDGNYYLGVNAGANWSGTTRRMTNAGAYIPYTLTENSTEIGDNLAAAQALGMMQTTDAGKPPHNFASTVTSVTITATAQGTMPAPGTYADTITYTVAW